MACHSMAFDFCVQCFVLSHFQAIRVSYAAIFVVGHFRRILEFIYCSFQLNFFFCCLTLCASLQWNRKREVTKKSKRWTDINVVNDSRCSSNIGYIRTFLAKCMFCATVPRVTCSVSDLFCIQKTKNCDQCALCRVEKSTRSKICSGCLSANSI